MFPVLSTQYVTSTLYDPAHGARTRDSTGPAATSKVTVTSRFRPTRWSVRSGTALCPPPAQSAEEVAEDRVAGFPAETPPHSPAGRQPVLSGTSDDGQYWNEQPRWHADRLACSFDDVHMCRGADAGLERQEEEEDMVFLKDPLNTVRRGGLTQRRPTRLPRMPSAAVALAKAEAAERLARRREASEASAPPAPKPVLPHRVKSPQLNMVDGSMTIGAPPLTTAAPLPASPPLVSLSEDPNQCAVRALFRQMLSDQTNTATDGPGAAEGTGFTAETPTLQPVAPVSERIYSAQPRRPSSHGGRSRQGAESAAGAPLPAEAPTMTVYELRATARHALPQTLTRQDGYRIDTVMGPSEDMSMEEWHLLYAEKASMESQYRWLLYQEQYERALLWQLEQTHCPVFFYNAQPSGNRGMLVRRLHAQPVLKTDEAIHEELDAALGRLTHRAHTPSACSPVQSPTTDRERSSVMEAEVESCSPPCTDSFARTLPRASLPSNTASSEVSSQMRASKLVTVEAQMAALLHIAEIEKGQLFSDGIRLVELVLSQKTLVAEERAARLAVVATQYALPREALQPSTPENSTTEAQSTLIDVLDQIPISQQFAVTVLEGIPAWQERVLAERDHQLAKWHDVLTLQIVALHVFDRFVHDEARQWEKLVSYHHFCLRVAAVQEENRRAAACDGALALAPPWHRADAQSDPIQRLRQQRLRYIGPHDSPFCSYLRYLEISITDRTEGETRQRLVSQEEADRADLLRAAEASLARVCVWEDCRDTFRALLGSESSARVALLARMDAAQAAIIAREERLRRLSAARHASEARVATFCADAYEQKQLYESNYLAEHLSIFRALRTECLLLVLQKTYERTDPAQMVLNWSVERSIHILVQQEHRLRQGLVEEEVAARSALSRQEAFWVHMFWPARQSVMKQEADAWDCLVAVRFEEHVCRERICAASAQQRAALFSTCLMQPLGVLAMVPLASATCAGAFTRPSADGNVLSFSASHLSQVAEATTQATDADHNQLPLVIPRSLNDTDRDAHLVLTSTAASSDLRISTFHSSTATSLPLSHSVPTYWDSVENPPLDARNLSGTLQTESTALSPSAEAELHALQQRLLQSYGGHRNEDDIDALGTVNSLSAALHNQPSPLSMDQSLMPVTHFPSTITTKSPPAAANAGGRREVKWGKTETIVCVNDEVDAASQPSNSDVASHSAANAFVGMPRSDDGPTDDCPFPSLLHTWGENKELDLRRLVVTNLQQFCEFDELVTFLF